MEKEGPQPAESEESSIYSPAFPREKWQRKRTQVKIRVWALWGCVGLELSPGAVGRCSQEGLLPSWRTPRAASGGSSGCHVLLSRVCPCRT